MAYDKPKLAYCYGCGHNVQCLPEPGGDMISGEKYISYTYRCPQCHKTLLVEKHPLPKQGDSND